MTKYWYRIKVGNGVNSPIRTYDVYMTVSTSHKLKAELGVTYVRYDGSEVAPNVK